MPAKADIQFRIGRFASYTYWIPAYAGMTNALANIQRCRLG